MVCRLKEEDSYSVWGEESLLGHPAAPCSLLTAGLTLDPRTPRLPLTGHRTAGPQASRGSPWPGWESWVGLLQWLSSLLAKPLVLDPSLQLLLLLIMFLPPNCTISPPSLGGWPWLLSHHTRPSWLLTHHKAPSPIPHSALCLFWNIYHC